MTKTSCRTGQTQEKPAWAPGRYQISGIFKISQDSTANKTEAKLRDLTRDGTCEINLKNRLSNLRVSQTHLKLETGKNRRVNHERGEETEHAKASAEKLVQTDPGGFPVAQGQDSKLPKQRPGSGPDQGPTFPTLELRPGAVQSVNLKSQPPPECCGSNGRRPNGALGSGRQQAGRSSTARFQPKTTEKLGPPE